MGQISFRLKPIAPFDLRFTAWALRRRPENIVDSWDGQSYRRVLVLRGRPLLIEVVQTAPPEDPVLRVAVSYQGRGSDVKPVVHSALERMLGLRVDLSGFYRFAMKDKQLRGLSKRFLGLKPPRFPTLFEALVNAFACQQLSLHVGILLLNRLATTCGIPFTSGQTTLYSFAQPDRMAETQLRVFRKLGFSHQKIRSLRELAQGVVQNTFHLENLEALDNDGALERLYKLRGVGRWSGEYVLLRGLGRTDMFPGDDVGGRNKLKKLLNLNEPLSYEGVKQVLGDWSPFGGLIYFHLLLQGLSQEGHV